MAIVIDAAPTHNALLTERGAFLSAPRPGHIDNFAITKHWASDRLQYWQIVGKSEDLQVRLSVRYHRQTMNMVVDVERTYKKDTHILNENLTLTALPPLSAAFRKNRIVETAIFKRDFRLERQGAILSNGDARNVLIQHVPRISSLQLTKDIPDPDFLPVTKFFPPPHDLAAAKVWGGYYASASSEDKQNIIFEIVFAREVDVTGVRIFWYRAQGKPTMVILRCVSKEVVNVSHVFNCREDTLSDDFILDQSVLCEKVEVEAVPTSFANGKGRVFINYIETFFGGSDYALVINMDDYGDHRFYSHLEPDQRVRQMTRVTENRSAYRRRSGDVSTSDFALYLGLPPARLDLRVMHVPYAYDAMLIWTEHADASTLDSHRAAYFGRSDITDAKDAIGGFIRWGIPVTKSVFFDNPERLPARRGGKVEQASISTSTDFWKFCEQLEQHGHEVCLHSDQPQASSPDSFAAAIDLFYSQFASRSWIDHSPMSVHGGASGQATRPGSPYYAVPRWRRHGVRFFWNVGSEDFSDGDAKSGLNILITKNGDDRITPLWWEHEVEAPGLCFWPSLRGGWPDIYDDEGIASLIRERGICINHTYPAAVWKSPKSAKNYLHVYSDGSARTTKIFETALRIISEARDEGRLLPTTVTKAFTYLRQIDKVSIEYRPNNRAVITNPTAEDIAGFSLAVAKSRIDPSVDLPCFKSRQSGTDILISFTLRATSCVLVRQEDDFLTLTSGAVGGDRN